MTDFMLVDLPGRGLSHEDKSNGKNGLKNGVGIQDAPQPWQITAVRTSVLGDMWLMSGDFQSQVWWGNEQATKQVCTDALLAGGIKDVPAVINTIQVQPMTQAETLQMLYDNAAEWGETIA